MSPDYFPDPDEVGVLEQVFGDLLTTGHSIQEAAHFLTQLSLGEVA